MDWARFILIFSVVVAGSSLVASGYLFFQAVLDKRALKVTGQNGTLKTLAWTLIVAEGIRFVKLVLLLLVVGLAFFFTSTELILLRRVLIVLVIGLISMGSIHGSISRRRLGEALGREASQTSIAAELARVTALTADSVDVQLKEIHALVNSDMTAARQSELIAIEAHLLTLRRIAAEEGPSEMEKEIFDNLEARAAELRAVIAERIEKQA